MVELKLYATKGLLFALNGACACTSLQVPILANRKGNPLLPPPPFLRPSRV